MAFRVFRGGESDSAEQIGPVLERLEALTTALEALGAPGHDDLHSTLSRMEKRDIQTFSAIDTFATALKSISHHLAHVRQSVQSGNAQHGVKLDGLTARLEAIETRLHSGMLDGFELDLSPLASALGAVGQRLSGLEAKLDQLARQQNHWPFDADAFATALAGIADRLARVEAKVDSVAQQPALEPEATSTLLAAIVERMGMVEHKVDSGADGNSIAACLLAVDRRLSRIESGLGMQRPLPAPADVPALQAQTVPPAEGGPPASGERVDQLLEQVFRVLAR